MSRLTGNEVYGLVEAYNSIYEEKQLVEELGIQIIENAAYVLFSQGYNVCDLCDYFAEASVDTIVEDYVDFSEGKVYLSESFIVSDEYIQEQFEILNEGIMDVVRGAAGWVGKGFQKAGQFLSNKSIPKAGKQLSLPLGQATKGAGAAASGAAGGATAAAKTPGILAKAGNFARNLVGKIPGAGLATKVAQSGAGKFAGKLLPGVGAALYGVDAANRFKKGDWGGGLINTAGAVASGLSATPLAPIAAPVAFGAGLVNMATDALGLTGDKSKGQSGGPKPTPDKNARWNASKALGGQASFKAGGGAAALKKDSNLTAADIQKRGNEALFKAGGGNAAMQGKTRAQVIAQGSSALAGKGQKATPAATTPAAPAATTSSTKTGKPPAGTAPTPKPSPQQDKTWAQAHPRLAEVERLRKQQKDSGGSTYDKDFRQNVVNPVMYGSRSVEDSQKQNPDKPADATASTTTSSTSGQTQASKPEPSQTQSSTSTQTQTAPATTAPATTATATTTKSPEQIAKDEARRRNLKTEQYDAYDVILDYLIKQGHASSIDEAHYIMLEMDSNQIQNILNEWIVPAVGLGLLTGGAIARAWQASQKGKEQGKKGGPISSSSASGIQGNANAYAGRQTRLNQEVQRQTGENY